MGERLTLGAPAPDYTLLEVDGKPVSLASTWAAGPALLVFVRHFG